MLVTDLAPAEEMVEGRIEAPPRTEHEAAILAALDRMALGEADPRATVTPAQVVAALVRLLVRRRVFTEQELLAELLRR